MLGLSLATPVLLIHYFLNHTKLFRYKSKNLKNKEISSTFGYYEKIELILVLISIQ
jgi:hypothetical protein